MKQLTITAIAILFSTTTSFAERNSFRDRSDNWLQRSNTEETTSDELRGAPGTGTTTPTLPTTPDPVGDLAFGLVLTLGLAYGVFLKNKKSL